MCMMMKASDKDGNSIYVQFDQDEEINFYFHSDNMEICQDATKLGELLQKTHYYESSIRFFYEAHEPNGESFRIEYYDDGITVECFRQGEEWDGSEYSYFVNHWKECTYSEC